MDKNNLKYVNKELRETLYTDFFEKFNNRPKKEYKINHGSDYGKYKKTIKFDKEQEFNYDNEIIVIEKEGHKTQYLS